MHTHIHTHTHHGIQELDAASQFRSSLTELSEEQAANRLPLTQADVVPLCGGSRDVHVITGELSVTCGDPLETEHLPRFPVDLAPGRSRVDGDEQSSSATLSGTPTLFASDFLLLLRQHLQHANCHSSSDFHIQYDQGQGRHVLEMWEERQIPLLRTKMVDSLLIDGYQ